MKNVIVRANEAGVFFGQLKEKNGNEVTLVNARKLHYWDGAAAVEQLSVDGTVAPDSCRFTVFVAEITIMNVCQILPCTNKAINSLKNVKEWKR